MEHILVALLVANIALAASVSASILYASGVPYPYVSPYALAYSYVHPPLVLSYPINVNFEAALAAAASSASPPIIAGTSLDGVLLADGGKESQENPSNQSPGPSSALGEVSPSTPSETSLPAEKSPLAGGESSFSDPLYPVPVAESGPTSESSLPPVSNDLKYYQLSSPVTYTIPKPLAWPEALQYHHQDRLGQYNYGYANEHSSKQEFKLLDGITRGAYNYVDAEGKLQSVSYVSDGQGFRVAATNLPQPVVPVEIPDSPEVAAVKAAHLQAQSQAVATVNEANAIDAAAAATAAAAAAAAAGGVAGIPGVSGVSASAAALNVDSGCNETSKEGSFK